MVRAQGSLAWSVDVRIHIQFYHPPGGGKQRKNRKTEKIQDRNTEAQKAQGSRGSSRYKGLAIAHADGNGFGAGAAPSLLGWSYVNLACVPEIFELSPISLLPRPEASRRRLPFAGVRGSVNSSAELCGRSGRIGEPLRSRARPGRNDGFERAASCSGPGDGGRIPRTPRRKPVRPVGRAPGSRSITAFRAPRQFPAKFEEPSGEASPASRGWRRFLFGEHVAASSSTAKLPRPQSPRMK